MGMDTLNIKLSDEVASKLHLAPTLEQVKLLQQITEDVKNSLIYCTSVNNEVLNFNFYCWEVQDHCRDPQIEMQIQCNINGEELSIHHRVSAQDVLHNLKEQLRSLVSKYSLAVATRVVSNNFAQIEKELVRRVPYSKFAASLI